MTARLHALARKSAVFTGFAAIAVMLTWPLARNLKTHVLGPLTGDTGVYVWNIWIFRHEFLKHGHLPFSTGHIFSITGGTDFALHNYTAIAGLLGAPLIGNLGVIGTFNVLMIAAIATSGYAVFILARYLGTGRVAAWAAGALFAAAPSLTARQTAHFSLVIAAPLPLFALSLLRTLDHLKTKDALTLGVLTAAATYCDAYYGVYCLLMGLVILACRFGRLERRDGTDARGAARFIDGLLALLVILISWRAWSGVTEVDIGPIRVGLQTLYTPMLAIVLLAALRCSFRWRPTLDGAAIQRQIGTLVRLGGLAVGVCLVLLSPVLVGLAIRFLNGRLPATEIFWRSSPRGIDLLAYLVPNPNHPLFGDTTRQWLLPDKPDAFPEFIGSFSLVALVVIALAARRRALPRLWVSFALFFVLLSLGPFVYIAGINTNVPGPWAFLRYMPVIGMARSPSRFAIVAALGLSLLFGFAVDERARSPRGSFALRRFELAAVAIALLFEVMAFPRPLYSAAVPDVYQLIATTNENSGGLLDLPTGVRDGTSSVGDFNASSQYFQTIHHRRLIGGYVSRVSAWRRSESMKPPILRAILALGEGRQISVEARAEALATRERFLANSCIRYVIVNKHRTAPALLAFAVEALNLVNVHDDAEYELLAPSSPPACDSEVSR